MLEALKAQHQRTAVTLGTVLRALTVAHVAGSVLGFPVVVRLAGVVDANC